MIRFPTLHRQLHLYGSTRHFATVLALAVALSSSAGLYLAPTARASDPDTFSPGSESQLVTLQNQARASGGLRTLKVDTALRTIARWRSKDMIERDYFSHTIPGSGTDHNVFWYLQHEYHYCFEAAGENIGQATWQGASEEDVTNYVFGLFMDSSGHRANILGKAWDVVAVGAYRTTGDHYVWTVLFADRCAAAVSPTPKPTAKPKPKPTHKPTPAPTAKPRPKAQPTPRPIPKPAKPPKAAATLNPAPSVASLPTPTPIPLPTPAPTAPPVPATRPAAAPATPPVRPAAWNGGNLPAGGLRVMDEPGAQGLLDSILSAVLAQFFGW